MSVNQSFRDMTCPETNERDQCGSSGRASATRKLDAEAAHARSAENESGESAPVIARLFQLSLASLEGYQEVADMSVAGELHEFVEVMLRQRFAQCRLLVRCMGKQSVRPLTADMATSNLRATWLRAVCQFDRGDFSEFVELAERAEAMLEAALQSGASSLPDISLANELHQQAVNLAGARERWRELGAVAC